MAEKLHLKIAVAEQPHTATIRNGSIAIQGVEAEFITVKPHIEKTAFDQGLTPRRMSVKELFVDPRNLAGRV